VSVGFSPAPPLISDPAAGPVSTKLLRSTRVLRLIIDTRVMGRTGVVAGEVEERDGVNVETLAL
jgi:hypothetical protein